MIRAVLFDLDDTLINSQTDVFLAEYLKSLAAHFADIVPSDTFSQMLFGAYEASLHQYSPAQTLEERFLTQFEDATQTSAGILKRMFEEYYDSRYAELRDIVSPIPDAYELLQSLHAQDIVCVIATNPALPMASIRQRLQWGGLDPDDPAIEFITSLETMRFGKPQSEYYEEILLKLGITASEAVMVGNDFEDDILPAQTGGLHSFFIGTNIEESKNGQGAFGGTLADFKKLVEARTFETSPFPPMSRHTLLTRLAAFPAAIDHIRRSSPPELLDCRPGAREWSVRDIVFHLVDHETAEDQARLETIANEDNPFLSTNYDPWTNIHVYDDLSLDFGFERFIELRTKTLDWLKSLDESVWSRPARSPIMGPTNFREMVQFITEHDRTHLRQMKESLAVAMALC